MLDHEGEVDTLGVVKILVRRNLSSRGLYGEEVSY